MGAVTPEMQNIFTQFKEIEPEVELGGIYARKKGYHGTRDENVANYPGNYSYAQFAVDREGPGDKAAAIDLTFPSAQRGDYSRISIYSTRLYRAGAGADPRTVYFREFFGQCDYDSEVEGYDYTKERDSSSDNSHLWHIHISVHRKYVGDPEMTRALLSILKGETVEQWRAGGGTPPAPDGLPVYASGSRMLHLTDPHMRGTDVLDMQRRIGSACGEPDGDFGPNTEAGVKAYQKAHGLDVDGEAGPKTWAALLAPPPAPKPSGLPNYDNGSRNLRLTSPYMKGTDVRALQMFIGSEWCGPADGEYGPNTVAGVKRYQKMRGLSVDGEAGPKTWAAIVAIIGR